MCAYIIHTIKSSLSQLYVCWKHNVSMKNDDDNDYGKYAEHAQTMSCTLTFGMKFLGDPCTTIPEIEPNTSVNKDDTSNFYKKVTVPE